MTIFIDGHRYGYELQRITQMFFFGEKVAVADGAPPAQYEEEHLHICLTEQGELRVAARLAPARCAAIIDGEAFSPNHPIAALAWEEKGLGADAASIENRFAVLVYELLSANTGLYPPWGVLTGIRPVKLLLGRMAAGDDEADIRRHFIEERLLDEGRFSLALETARVEQPIIAQSTSDSYSLYVSIPFCPTRCTYCSFVSHSIEKAADLIPPYLDRLCEEIAYTAEIMRTLGLRLRTVYIGGGTPTSITARQLEMVMRAVSDSFDISELWEYTVEAGRPDTIDTEKLAVIRAGGAGRISINPQTLSDSVLAEIGRPHTAEDAMQAYAIAREIGFDAINMDLIAGLPTDTVEGFCASIDGVIAAAPENITVHTLTLKRAAALSHVQASDKLRAVREMVDYARKAVALAGYRPYYLYRQNGSLSALENVGYARQGSEGLYNVYMMDETHSVVAVGAGGSTRLCDDSGRKIERVYNYKYPYEYLARFDEILRRKETIKRFYSQDGL